MSAAPEATGPAMTPAESTAPFADARPDTGQTAEGAAPAVRTPDGRPLDLRQQFLTSGWRQGAVLPHELAARVQMIPGADAAPAGDGSEGPWLVIVSQDCDLVYGDCVADPEAEVVLATPIAQPSAKCERLRNPRELHVRLTRADGTTQPVAIEVRNRGFLTRALLLTAGPATEVAADATAARWMAGLVARRYIRTARPETFDRRFRKARKKITDLLETEAGALLDVMLGIEPRQELEPDQRYAVSVYPILQDEFGDQPRPAQQKRRNAINEALRQAMLPCKDEGIDVEIIEIKTRYDVSLREYDDLLPMDLGPP